MVGPIYWICLLVFVSLTVPTFPTGQDKSIEILPSLDEIVVDRQDNLSLTCKARINCTEEAKWFYKVHGKAGEFKIKSCFGPKYHNTKTCHYQRIIPPGWKAHTYIYTCWVKVNLSCTDGQKSSFQKQIKVTLYNPSPPSVNLTKNKQNVTANSNASFNLELNGSPMPSLNCTDNNGSLVISCPSSTMKLVMYNKPSRHACNSIDGHYRLRSRMDLTRKVVFEIFNVTTTRDNGAIYCNWKNSKTKGAQQKFSMQIIVYEKRVSAFSSPPSKTTDSTLSASSGGLDTRNIIGIVIGVGVFLVILVIINLLWQRRQRRKMLFYKHQYFLRTGDYTVDPSLTLNEQSMNLPYDSDWEFPFERLLVGDRLGAGAFGEVYKADAMGILALNARDKGGTANKRRSKLRRSLRGSQRPNNAVVAVKTSKGSATESEIRDLAAELKLMIHIGEHKNIVNLLGACTTGRKLYVILEFCRHGDLLSFLRSKRNIFKSTWDKEVFDPETEFTLIDLVGAAFQVAEGMAFLAERKLIHRDLAARNILVADEYVMKIADFGLARDIYKDHVYVKMSSGFLPVKWMPMESLFDRVYTHQSDVWSFGILLWEMMTLGGAPYPGLAAGDLLDYLRNGKRMPQPDKCPLEVYTIMRDCWLKEPEQRPTFANLVEHFGRILEKHLEKSPYLTVEATQEEIEVAKDKALLLKPKSDYYLEPLLLANRQQRYDALPTPLPTPPTDVSTPTYIEPILPMESEPRPSKLRAAGSCELLREDDKDKGFNPPRVSSDNESGIIGLEDMNGRNRDRKDDLQAAKNVETVL